MQLKSYFGFQWKSLGFSLTKAEQNVQGLPINRNEKDLNNICVFDNSVLQGIRYKWYENNQQKNYGQMHNKFKSPEFCDQAIKILHWCRLVDDRYLKARDQYTKYCSLWILNGTCKIQQCPCINQLLLITNLMISVYLMGYYWKESKVNISKMNKIIF